MAFKVTDAARLTAEADRIEAILLSPHFRGKEWEEADFILHLASIGLVYEQNELVAIRTELITRGVVEII